MYGFRKIEGLGEKIAGNDPGPVPEVQFLSPSQLVINEEYQRDLSRNSLRMIRKMAAAWDWSAFKAPSVARTGHPDVYEVVDGQHTAIAAETNGNIPFLPCLVMTAETLEAKAKGFLGINQDRIALSRVAIYNAQVAAKDGPAITVEAALSRSGVELVAMPPNNGAAFKAGQTMAIGTMLALGAKGEDRLHLLLSILKGAQAAPISSCQLKALDLALPHEGRDVTPDVFNRLVTVLRSQGPGRLELIAKSRTERGKRSYETLSDIIADMAKLDGRRLGAPAKAPKGKGGRPLGWRKAKPEASV